MKPEKILESNSTSELHLARGWWLACVGQADATEIPDRTPRSEPVISTLLATAASGRSLRVVSVQGQDAPATATDGSLGVVLDGILYNAADLRARLGHKDPPAANPAELILRAYQSWGADVLPRLRGIFALVIFDARQDCLVYTRDPIGVHPLFSTDTGREVLVSPVIEALLWHPHTSPALNRAALADHLFSRWPNPEETFYTHIDRVPQGHAVRVMGGVREAYRHWDPVPPGSKVNWVREDELDQFDVLLDQAVNRCLEIGPAGIYLSGGLDSVSIAAVATDNCRRSGIPAPLALSLAFPYNAAETAIQRGVARELGLEQVMVPLQDALDGKGLLHSALELSREWPMPLGGPWRPAYQHLGALGRAQGCRVVLTGAGGDEWLTVTPTYAADLLRTFSLVGVYRLGASIARSFQVSPVRAVRGVLWRFGARPLLSAAAQGVLRQVAPEKLHQFRRRRLLRDPAWLAPDQELRNELDHRLEQALVQQIATSDSFYFREVRTSIEHALVAMELEDAFEASRRLGMHHGSPFWDADLVDFLYRTPPELLLQGGRSKGLVRGMLDRRFPDLGFERQKKVVASSADFQSQMVHEGRLAWKAMGGAPVLAELGIVDQAPLNVAVKAIFSAPPQEANSWLVWQLLNLEAWVQSRA